VIEKVPIADLVTGANLRDGSIPLSGSAPTRHLELACGGRRYWACDGQIWI